MPLQTEEHPVYYASIVIRTLDKPKNIILNDTSCVYSQINI